MAKRQIALIIVVTALVAIIHIFIPERWLALHILFRLLYFIPIVYTALAYGRKGGFAAALAITFIFLPHFFFSQASPEFLAGNGVAIVLFFLCGFLVGSFRDASEVKLLRKLGRRQIVPLSGHDRHKVLFYVDGTPLSLGAAEWFAGRSDLGGLSVTLLGIDTRDREEKLADQLAGAAGEDEERDINESLDRIRQTLVSRGMKDEALGTICLDKTDRIPVAEQIAMYAREHRFDLVLMCKHDKKKSEEFLFGDTAIQLIRKTTIPLLIVKGIDDPMLSPQ